MGESRGFRVWDSLGFGSRFLKGEFRGRIEIRIGGVERSVSGVILAA